MKNNPERLIILDLEMPIDDGSEARVVSADRLHSDAKPDIVIDPRIVASSMTPEELMKAVEEATESEVTDGGEA